MIPIVVASVLWLVAGTAVADEIRPRATPRLYVTHNHGVRLDVPEGLTYCRLPEGWVGTDHGRSMFIGRARDCDDQDRPTIGVYYEFNQSEIEGADGSTRVLRSDLELRARRCEGQRIARVGLSLLGRTAALCLERTGSGAVLTAYALYDILGRKAGQESPDHELTVVLSTTPRRFDRDLTLFRLVLAGISVCTPEWVRDGHSPPTCPRHSFWW